MPEVFLILGSNKGNRKKYIKIGIYLINNLIGKIHRKSSYYESEAWGMTNSNYFLNRVVILNTIYTPVHILKIISYIEFIIGRKKNKNIIYDNREIDIDILFYEQIIFKSSELLIPHYLLHVRKFVLYPLCEICPEKNHPVFNLSLINILILCQDILNVKKIS